MATNLLPAGRCVIAVLGALALTASSGAPPVPGAPLIKKVSPLAGLQNEPILINGVNFGSVPQVSFNGQPAGTVAYRPDLGGLVVTVPPGSLSGPLTVFNPDLGQTSNAASFDVLPGVFSSACTLDGTVVDSSPVPAAVSDVLVVASSANGDVFAGLDVTDGAGQYSIGIESAGDYALAFIPQDGSVLHEKVVVAACPGTWNEQLSSGVLLSGRVVDDTATPIPSALVTLDGVAGFSAERVTPANGTFAFRLPPDTYDVLFEGPVGSRHVSELSTGVVVPGDTDLGDIALDTGVLVSGELSLRDGPASRPRGGTTIVEFDTIGQIVGATTTIADGSFYLATLPGFFSLGIDGLDDVIESVFVPFIDVSGDTTLDFPMVQYMTAGQTPAAPVIDGSDVPTAQDGDRILLDVIHVRGAAVEVLFASGGGTVAGDDTVVLPERGAVVTTVPAGATTGGVVVRVDGVDSAAYPMTILPGLHSPGPFTTSGVVTDGTDPLVGVPVAILEFDCDIDILVDYERTGPGGAYSLQHDTGPHILVVLPPVDSGLASSFRSFPNVTGNQTENVALGPGNLVTATCSDSGVGVVGGTSALADCALWAERLDDDHDEAVLSDELGEIALRLPSGDYELGIDPPHGSRYLAPEGGEETIVGDTDFGDIALDSGNFISGRIVDPSGSGLAGVELVAVSVPDFTEVARSVSIGPDGEFRVAVPPGEYDLFFDAPWEQPYFVPPVFRRIVTTDVLLYPAIEALEVGRVRGTVRDASMTPLAGIPVSAWIPGFGPVDGVETCLDGTYDLRSPTGDATIEALPSEVDPCLADESWNNHYAGCGSDPLAVVAPGVIGGVDFTLEPAGVISGTILDDLGAPLGGVTVCANDGDALPFCFSKCTASESDGTYTLTNLPVGADYRVESFGGGYPLECWDDHLDCTTYDPVAVGDCVLTPGVDFLLSGAPGRVPDGHFVAGTPMRASRNPATGELTITWQPTCSADDHAVYFGSLGNFGVYTDAVCAAGLAGSLVLVPPPGDLFWVVVGVNGINEGSYGFDSNLAERPEDPGLPCVLSQDLSATCVP